MVPSASPTQSAQNADCDTALALVINNLTKEFPGVRALSGVNLSMAPGEILALLGQNGAGKSTLIQILAGVHGAGSYAGSITLAGASYSPASVAEAERRGVAFVPQEVNVVPEMSVAENICLNNEPTRWGIIDVAARRARALVALREFDLEVDPEAEMGSLNLATQQLVIIARALSKKARLLILDEPTAALTENESARLFARVRALKARGVSIIFVSHRLAEVFTISDRIVVMRDGRLCGDHLASEVSRAEIVAEMVGDVVVASPSRLPASVEAKVALAVQGLNVFDAGSDRRQVVQGLDLDVYAGEIVGLFGLLGAGCIETALAIYGAWRGPRSGSVRIDGSAVFISGPQQAVALGLGLMAQDRRDCLIQDQSVADNIALASLPQLAPRGLLDGTRLRRLALEGVGALDIKTASIDAPVRTLSGGNQQKVQIARWLAAGAHILILIDPTRGVDVGARSEIKRIWADLGRKGTAILIASTDAEELVDVCDRVSVMNKGRCVGELHGAALNEHELLRMAADD